MKPLKAHTALRGYTDSRRAVARYDQQARQQEQARMNRLSLFAGVVGFLTVIALALFT